MSVRSSLRRLERQAERVLGGPAAICSCQPAIVVVNQKCDPPVPRTPVPTDPRCEACGRIREVIDVQVVEVRVPFPDWSRRE